MYYLSPLLGYLFIYPGNKNYYLYYCSNCRHETPYCFDCNKSIDFLLSSMFFKCVTCMHLIKVTKRETVYRGSDDGLFNSLFLKQEESEILKPPRLVKKVDFEFNDLCRYII
jgi:hypothetical protein